MKKFELVFTFNERPALATLGKFGAVIDGDNWEIREIEVSSYQTAAVVEVNEPIVEEAVKSKPMNVIGDRGRLKWQKWEMLLASDETVSSHDVAERTHRTLAAVQTYRSASKDDRRRASGMPPHRWTEDEDSIIEEYISAGGVTTDGDGIAELAEMLEQTYQATSARLYKILGDKKSA